MKFGGHEKDADVRDGNPTDPGDSRAPATRNSIISPSIDYICVGLGSIIFLAPLAIFGNEWILGLGGGLLATLTICVNMPHFMASYRIAYGSKETILRYKTATLIVPALLIVYILFALGQAEQNMDYILWLAMASSFYLAWHYTGQIWGMMATYAFLDGVPFAKKERIFIRSGLRIQLVWHVSWVLHEAPATPELTKIYNGVYLLMSAATAIAYALALTGLFLYWRRAKRLPPMRALIAWLAICFWYGALARNSEAFFWVQMAHAVQYLGFPIRVELNTYQREHSIQRSDARGHMLLYFGVLIGAGVLLNWLADEVAVPLAGSLWGKGGTATQIIPNVILTFVNIHHYFTDSCIWKISSPTVREDLFAHLEQKSA